MREDEIWMIRGLVIVFMLLAIVAASMIAGNIVNQLLEPIPEVAGPLGAAAALLVFVILMGEGQSLLADVLSQ